MTFGDDVVRVSYPDLGCTGTLTADGLDGRRRVYLEHIDRGTCDRDGTWRILRRSRHEISAAWSYPRDRYTVTAVLRRP